MSEMQFEEINLPQEEDQTLKEMDKRLSRSVRMDLMSLADQFEG